MERGELQLTPDGKRIAVSRSHPSFEVILLCEAKPWLVPTFLSWVATVSALLTVGLSKSSAAFSPVTK